MKRLLIATAAIEAGAGVALIAIPSSVTTLLIGAQLTTAAALTVARVGGAGVLSLGVACWLARGDAQSGGARALVVAMLLYNVAAVVILGDASMQSQPVGVALWPVVVLHSAMAAWCVLNLVRTPSRRLR
jgi:multisubunit Na+/H+ antiporter MnhG subunit